MESRLRAGKGAGGAGARCRREFEFVSVGVFGRKGWMFKTLSWVVVWFGLSLAAWAAGVGEGMTRAEVEAAVGKPLSVLERNGTTVMRYPNDGRVELTGGRVTRVVRVRHVSDPATPEELAAEEAAKLAKAEAEAARAEAKAEAEAAKAAAAAEAEWEKAQIEARAAMEADVARLTAEHEGGPGAAIGGMMGGPSPNEFWTMLGIGALVQIGVGMVILKLSFRWADVHADWGQMLWPAAAAMAGGAAVRAAGFAAWDVTEFFHMDDAVSYVALLVTLLKTTHACTWQRAFAVAAAAKLMTIVVWTFLSVALSRVLFA
jgi:nucleoid-associated protein YgaU